MKMEIIIKEYEEFYEFKLPTHFEVCYRCEGHGTHVNPAIDGNGISAQEWNEWEDSSRSMYMNGGYDIACEDCNGMRVVPVVNESALTKEIQDKWSKHLDDWFADEAQRRAEDRMGC